MESDRIILRDLARRVRQIADDPTMPERRRRWRRHNRLQPERPLVLCFPEGGWPDLLPQSAMRCTDPKFRQWEWVLRSKVYWWEQIRDDNILEPFFDIHWKIAIGGYGFDIPYTRGDDRGSYVWDAPMKDLEHDFAKLHFRPLSVDRDATLADVRLAGDVFGDLLPPRVRGMIWWTTGLTWEAAKLIGLENLMWAMCDQPAQLHRLMAFLRDDQTNVIEWCEREGLLSANDGADYVGSGGVGCLTDAPPGADAPAVAPCRLADRWGFAESQETVGVSPTMFEEFVLPYQVPLLEKSALNCYGCCEGLEHRIGRVLDAVPRLRRVSVAPNADQKTLAERLGGKYIFSRKPYPGHVCVGFNEPAIRADLRHTLDVVGDAPLELILKDTHTLEKEPWRVTRWVQIAREEIDRSLQARGRTLVAE